MVSRLFGKLEARRHLMFGKAGACAMACDAAAAETAPPATAARVRDLRRSMECSSVVFFVKAFNKSCKAEFSPQVHLKRGDFWVRVARGSHTETRWAHYCGADF